MNLTVLVNTVTRLLLDLPPRDAIFHYFLQNNVGLGKCYQSRPLLITLTSTVIIPDITKPHPVLVYYLTESASRRGETNAVILPTGGFPRWPARKSSPSDNKTNPLLTNLVHS